MPFFVTDIRFYLLGIYFFLLFSNTRGFQGLCRHHAVTKTRQMKSQWVEENSYTHIWWPSYIPQVTIIKIEVWSIWMRWTNDSCRLLLLLLLANLSRANRSSSSHVPWKCLKSRGFLVTPESECGWVMNAEKLSPSSYQLGRFACVWICKLFLNDDDRMMMGRKFMNGKRRRQLSNRHERRHTLRATSILKLAMILADCAKATCQVE